MLHRRDSSLVRSVPLSLCVLLYLIQDTNSKPVTLLSDYLLLDVQTLSPLMYTVSSLLL